MSIVFIIAAVIVLGICAVFGVFSPRGISGPERLAPEQPPTSLFGVACLGLLTWSMIYFVFISLPGNQVSGTTRPEIFTEPLGVAVSIVAYLGAVTVMIAI